MAAIIKILSDACPYLILQMSPWTARMATRKCVEHEISEEKYKMIKFSLPLSSILSLTPMPDMKDLVVCHLLEEKQ